MPLNISSGFLYDHTEIKTEQFGFDNIQEYTSKEHMNRPEYELYLQNKSFASDSFSGAYVSLIPQ